MDLRGSRILVTGGSGLLGSFIIDRLIGEQPKEIIAFDGDISHHFKNVSPGLDYNIVKLFKGDIRQMGELKEAFEGVNFVIHTASLLTREAAENLRAALEVNICGTFNVLDASVTSGVKKIIYISSSSAYGEPLSIPMTEDHPFNVTSMYGACKGASELLLRVFQKKGLEYVTLRPTSIYGPRQHYRTNIVLYIPECFDRIEKGQRPIIYGDGSQPFDYVYVDDVARASIVALKSPVTGEAFNIGTGATTRVGDVVRMIVEITGTSLQPEYAPLGDRFLGIKSNYLDITKTEKVLGFKTEVSLKEGLKRYFEWRKKKGQYQEFGH
jgi:UDP-glucose 4-epimerase